MKEKSPQESKKKLDKHYDEFAWIRTVYKWFQTFQSDYMSTSDTERSGHPVEVTTPEIIEEIDDMMLDNRKMKVIANAVDISIERIHIFCINIWT